jgi:hypothetical protein
MTVHQQPRRRFLLCLAVRTMLIAGFTCGWAPPAAAEADPAIVRVRSSDAHLASLIERAARTSTTFRRLLATIERTNGIVQVETGSCRHSVRACLLMWMETSASTRYLRVIIDRRKSDADVDVMAAIAHELQHAVEALSESGVTTGLLLYNFFKRFAPTDNNRFETTAAIDAGDDVRGELRRR